MKQDAINDTMTIMVEPGDERLHVLNMLEQSAGQRVIVVLPGEAVFRRPGDLRELQQVAVQVNVELILVIANNESLRLWARRHGFTVFSSVGSCARAQMTARLPFVTRSLLTEELEMTETRSREHLINTDSEFQIEDVSENIYPPQPIVFPKAAGQFKAPGVSIARNAPRITEPLYMRSAAQRVSNVMPDHMQRDVVDTPADVQLIDVQKALYQQIAEEKEQDRHAQAFSLLPAEAEHATTSLLPVEDAPLARRAARSIWPDRFLFVLVAILALGIMGGVGFAYLLGLTHSVPVTILPASLFMYLGVH
jgi:hypothetical protein